MIPVNTSNPPVPPGEMLIRILSHVDNYSPVTADWLHSIGVPCGDGEGTLVEEHEMTIQVVDTRSNTQLFSSYGNEWEECTVLGYNVRSQEIYIETYGGKMPFSTETLDVIILPPVSTRLEFRLLLIAHKAWGYAGG